jgi:hypothetical protein
MRIQSTVRSSLSRTGVGRRKNLFVRPSHVLSSSGGTTDRPNLGSGFPKEVLGKRALLPFSLSLPLFRPHTSEHSSLFCACGTAWALKTDLWPCHIAVARKRIPIGLEREAMGMRLLGIGEHRVLLYGGAWAITGERVSRTQLLRPAR